MIPLGTVILFMEIMSNLNTKTPLKRYWICYFSLAEAPESNLPNWLGFGGMKKPYNPPPQLPSRKVQDEIHVSPAAPGLAWAGSGGSEVQAPSGAGELGLSVHHWVRGKRPWGTHMGWATVKESWVLLQPLHTSWCSCAGASGWQLPPPLFLLLVLELPRASQFQCQTNS